MSLPAPTCYYVGEPYGNLTFTKPEPLIPAITKPLWNEKTVAGLQAEIDRLRQALIGIRDATHTSAVVLRGLADNALTKD